MDRVVFHHFCIPEPPRNRAIRFKVHSPVHAFCAVHAPAAEDEFWSKSCGAEGLIKARFGKGLIINQEWETKGEKNQKSIH